MRITKENEGITLIALVVTIIVLLILAGVSISVLSGDNGILLNVSKSNTENAYYGAKEQVELAFMSVKIEIMTQVVKDGAYDARTEESILRLTEIVSNELNDSSSKWQVSSVDEKIKIKYKDPKIDKDVINSGVPAQEGEINAVILLEEQEAILQFDVGEGKTSIANVTVENMKVEKGRKVAVNIENKEKVEDVTYSSSDTSIATVDENGYITGIKYGITSITLEGKESGNTNTIQIEVIPIIGQYVEYNVGYQDMGTNGEEYIFNTQNGWRILDEGTYNESDDSYSETRIISSGEPVGLFFQSERDINNEWWDTSKEKISDQVVSGLSDSTYFNKIKFIYYAKGIEKDPDKNDDNYNMGYYKKIMQYIGNSEITISNGSGQKNAKELFDVYNKDVEIKTLTIRDANDALNKLGKSISDRQSNPNIVRDYKDEEDSIGLIRLSQLTKDNYQSKYSEYWFATRGNDTGIYKINNTGNIAYTSKYCKLRVVITLKSKIKKDGEIWKIQQ